MDKEYLYQQYIVLNRTTRDIAQEHSSTEDCIRYLCKKYGISKYPWNKPSIPKDELVRLYQEENLTKKEIAKIFSTSQYYIAKIMKELGIKTDSKFRISKAHRKYWDSKRASYEEISGDYWSILRCNAERRDIEFSISVEYAWDVFLKQNRKCAISNVDILFSESIRTKKDRKKKTASLDRIDSSKGYIASNIQWVHKKVNKLKGNMSDDEFIYWCNLISENNKNA